MPEVRLAHRGDLAALVAIYNYYVEHSNATFDTELVTVEGRTSWFETFSEVGPHRLSVGVRDMGIGVGERCGRAFSEG